MKFSLSQLYEGWRNKLLPPEDLKETIEAVSESRTLICNQCDYHSDYHRSIRPDAHCTLCECTLSAKTRCLSCDCPIFKWKAVITPEQEEEMTDGE